MLHDTGMKPLHRAVDWLPVLIKSCVSDVLPARHHSTLTRHREAPFDPLFQSRLDRINLRIAQDRSGHKRGIWITGVRMITAKDDYLQADTDLRSRQSSTLGGLHGIEHIGHQLMQLRRIKGGNWLGLKKQPGVTDLENFTCCHVVRISPIEVSVEFPPGS